MGFIIRDDQGMMVLAGEGKEGFLLDALHAVLKRQCSWG